ncbi:MAG: RnfABCDGE type electron transport complex subunit B, partial [Clostridia bacterium]|nr:RnfABCDGE type electron transport complex subunit B [Clostridia bacterium]
MYGILIALAVIAVLGLVASLLLSVASHFMKVEEDEKAKRLRECLPGINCGACGFTGCDDYAAALSQGNVKTNLCIPGADSVAAEIADILGVAAEDVVEKVAVVHCNGTCDAIQEKNDYFGIDSCAAKLQLYGGPFECKYGCLGSGDCAAVCPNDAICLKDGVARIDRRKCVGCGLCSKTCPQHIIHLVKDTTRVVVKCSNKDKGAEVRRICKIGCIGCGKCERSCPSGAIFVKDNLAEIDYSKCTSCGLCAEV